MKYKLQTQMYPTQYSTIHVFNCKWHHGTDSVYVWNPSLEWSNKRRKKQTGLV